MYSLEDKGTISQMELPPFNTPITPALPVQVLISGLRSPRGMAMDSSKQILFFTEKTGRIFQAKLAKTMTARQKANILADDASIVAPTVEIRRIVTRPSMIRLDGIAVDSRYLYWCETNTNTVARALRRDFQRQVVVGGTANSKLRQNELDQSYYYSEYTGRISKGAAQTIIVNALNAPAMQYLDSVVQQSSIQGGLDHFYLYALE
ncbi:hypothetical protein PHMEG_00036522 [Phytophthora megakarya]|uniref:Uncharacterized protein n=1 Tax=Phytophthora megakarya TaxID=4795 RepID=A0A225UKZ4_9STRA|nr:hypothetical protein PHMEG_00036522 [Phytophthora megakarya]